MINVVIFNCIPLNLKQMIVEEVNGKTTDVHFDYVLKSQNLWGGGGGGGRISQAAISLRCLENIIQ